MRESWTGVAVALLAAACCLLVPLAVAGGVSAVAGAAGGQTGLVLAGVTVTGVALGVWAWRRRRA